MCDIDQYPLYAEMIRSDQMTHDQVHQFLDDHPGFAAWYEGQYLNSIGYQDYVDANTTEEKLEKWADKNPNNEWVQNAAADKILEIWKNKRR